MRLPLVAALCFLGHICIAEKTNSSYIFTSPRSLKNGGDNQLQLFRFGCTDESSIGVKLYFSMGANGNETLATERMYDLREGELNSYFNFQVPRFSTDNYYNARLQLNGTICGKSISGSSAVEYSTRKTNIIIIQTDKPFYHQADTVKFRVLKLDSQLKPSQEDNDVADVYIEDPRRTRLFEFNKIHLGKGIVQKEIPLSDDPMKGKWSITVTNGDYTESTTFEVKEFVLPKFEVKINFPSFVLANADVVPVKICAKYTYGKPVTGQLNLNASFEPYTWNNEKNPILQESFKINGCYDYSINVSLIETDKTYRYRRILVVANVVEDGTGVQINATQYLSRQYYPLNLNFRNYQYQTQYFKPGLPYNGKLRVTNPDNTPAGDEPIEICATVSQEKVISEWFANKRIKFCRNYTSDKNGFIKYTVSPQNIDSVSIQLEARSLKYTKKPEDTDGIFYEPRISLYLSPFYSPSKSFIQLVTVEKPLSCDSHQPITLLFTSEVDSAYKFYFQVIRQGEVVQAGTKEASFSVDDDVSKKYEDDTQLINESVTQIFPVPSNRKDYCPAARDSKYVPPIGEVQIPIDTYTYLSPSFNLLVFYIRDNETVADSQKIEVEKCYQNKVDFKFTDKEKQPGTETSIQVTASPNSICGLQIQDKGLSLLGNDDQLNSDKVFQLLENLDTNLYFSTNPCNDNTPQPGLFSSKFISPRPPGRPYYSSSYEDSYAVFQHTGNIVISNLILFTRPCKSDGGPIGRAMAFDTEGASFGPGGGLGGSGGAGNRGPINTISTKEVRDYFPETWLFDLRMTDEDGHYSSKEILPDTITDWEGCAFCIHPEDGLGLSNIATTRGFQSFFLSYTLPTSAIRGEEFSVVVSIFNYVDKALPIAVSLDDPQGMEIVGDSINDNVCIQPDTSSNLKLKLKATTVGKINITVRAETAKTRNIICGSSDVYDQHAKDAITHSLEVEAEGFPAETVKSILFCPTNNKMFSYSFDLSPPEDGVPDSSRAYIDVTGNILGPAIQNLDSLVAIPTGCGEQNMVKFTPNYLVLDYLKDIGKLTDIIKSQAIRNLETGYQRELNYRHTDGSFSEFGPVDKAGSMFVTAFVLRSFYEAQRYITIDKSLITTMQNFIASNQNDDGCFPSIGRLIDTSFQGGLNPNSMTPYVLASLLISKYENKNVILKALSCLQRNSPATPYETFLYAYAEALGGNIKSAKKRIVDIKPFANTTDGVEYYNNPNGTNSLNLETAAYAILSSLQLENGAADALPVVRYLAQNMNSNGGFFSTQDTVVGLDALSKYAKVVYRHPDDIRVTISGGLDEKLQITEDNKLLVQRKKVPKVPTQLKIEASGSGCGLVQTSLRYNTKTAPKNTKFILEVDGSCIDKDCKKRKINTVVRYVPEGKKAGMSVLQIKMVSGTVPSRTSLEQLMAVHRNNILRFDVEKNEVIFYFSEVSNSGYAFSFGVEEVIEVSNAQPGTAKVFDYYAPENSATTSYRFRSA